jgi:hypothetical protein
VLWLTGDVVFDPALLTLSGQSTPAA